MAFYFTGAHREDGPFSQVERKYIEEKRISLKRTNRVLRIFSGNRAKAVPTASIGMGVCRVIRSSEDQPAARRSEIGERGCATKPDLPSHCLMVARGSSEHRVQLPDAEVQDQGFEES